MKKIIVILLVMCTSLVQAQKKKTKVACVGDSVTFGYLLENREETSYPSQLQKMLGEKYEVGNFGKSGATLLAKGHRPYIEQEEYKKALDFSADLVIIHLGLNDTDPRNWPNHKEHFFKDYLNLIDSFKKVNPNAKFWICRMTPITHKHLRFVSGTRDWYAQIQKEIERVADYAKVELIDLQEVLYNRPDLLPDALHPSQQGAKMIAERVFGALTGNFGGFQLPEIYSDNMVFQQQKNIVFHGKSNSGDVVTATIQKKENGKIKDIEKITVNASKSGKWMVSFQELTAGTDFQVLFSVNKKNVKILKNIAIGEVFLCSGQSNMAYFLKDEIEFKKDNDYGLKNVRIFDMKPRRETYATEWDLEVLDTINQLKYYKTANWEELTNKNAEKFSAVAYHFAKKMQDSLNVPIGLIHNAVGGSNLESWIDRSTLEKQFPEILKDWRKNDFIQDWVRDRASLNIKKSTVVEQRHPYEPAYLFEAGVLPFQNYEISGVLWYQGESNAHNIEAFERLFPMFVNSWRIFFNNEKLPIYFVQLSSLNRPSWGWFRDAQRKLAMKLSNTYMVVSSDKGDETDVHPKQKKDIGERLAWQVMHHQFGKKMLIPSGPLFKKVVFEGDSAWVSFDYSEGLQGEKAQPIIGFELAEVEGMYFPANAKVVGDRVQVQALEVKNPKFIRYAFSPFTRANLVNKANLPASTFKN